MKIALLADVHANLDALEACLRHAGEHGAERFAFLGDLVGYGAEPGSVTDVIARYAAQGAIVVRGNHDTSPDDWTASMLTAQQRAFLASLPLGLRDGDMSFVHSSARAPESWEYIETASAARETIDAANTTYTFAGHVHDQVLYFKTLAGKTAPFRPLSGRAVPVPPHRGWLAIVGSCGQPRDRNPAAAYAIFDESAEEMTFYRVPYDHAAAAQKIRRAGLPEWTAQRIEQGI